MNAIYTTPKTFKSPPADISESVTMENRKDSRLTSIVFRTKKERELVGNFLIQSLKWLLNQTGKYPSNLKNRLTFFKTEKISWDLHYELYLAKRLISSMRFFQGIKSCLSIIIIVPRVVHMIYSSFKIHILSANVKSTVYHINSFNDILFSFSYNSYG